MSRGRRIVPSHVPRAHKNALRIILKAFSQGFAPAYSLCCPGDITTALSSFGPDTAQGMMSCFPKGAHSSSRYAMASTSHSTPLGSVFTATQDLAGRLTKYFS